MTHLLIIQLLCCIRGPLFGDDDWLQPDYMEIHQRGIQSILTELQDIYVEAGYAEELQERNPQPTMEAIAKDTDDSTLIELVDMVDYTKIKPSSIFPSTNQNAECDTLNENITSSTTYEENSDMMDGNDMLTRPTAAANAAKNEQIAELKFTDSTHECKSRGNINKSDLVPLNSDQTSNLPFPIGCHVEWSTHRFDASDETFNSGKVIGAAFHFIARELLYEVLLDDESSTWFIRGDDLSYASACPIYYSPPFSPNEKEQELEGEIILSRRSKTVDDPTVCYTAMIIHPSERDRIRVIDGIIPSQIRLKQNHS